MLSPRTQRLGNLVAGTFVVREPKVATGGAVTFPAPRGFEQYVAMLDIATVTPEQYELIRSFLLRVLDFDTAARLQLAADLAAPLAKQLRHRPPNTVSAETFLVCVAAAYQQRNRRHVVSPPQPAAPWGTPQAWGPARWPPPPPARR